MTLCDNGMMMMRIVKENTVLIHLVQMEMEIVGDYGDYVRL